MKKMVFVLLFGLGLLSQAIAAETHKVRLSELYAGDSTLRMEGAVAEFELSVPLSGGLKVEKATLDMRAVNSIALIRQRSVLAVRFNNATISQIALDPNAPNFRPEIDIPAELWREGFNTLTFAVSQHYANQCVDNAAPELWSEIDLYRSVLSVETSAVNGPAVLADLKNRFNPGIGRQHGVTLFTASGAEQSTLTTALPLVAQALALRADYQNLAIRHGVLDNTRALPARDDLTPWSDEQAERYRISSFYLDNRSKEALHVVVGTASSLRPFLSEQTFNQIGDAYLGIESTPAIVVDDKVLVPARQRLIVSGTNEGQVQRAATTLALMDDALNPDPFILIDGFQTASNQVPLVADTLTPGESYSFQDMGDGGAEYRGETATTKRVEFNLPADFYVPENATVTLLLDFAYGAEFGQGSMMNVLINGKLVHGLPLSNPNGDSFRKYQLNVPARHLKGGRNRLDFDVAMRAPITDVVCDDVAGRHLYFQLLPDSRIELPEAGHVARQPDLRLFGETAYPMASVVRKSADIYVTRPDMTGGALTLAGKLAQTAGTLLPDIHVIEGVPGTTTDTAFLMTTPDSVPQGYATAFGASLESAKKWPYRLQNMLHNRLREAAEDKQHKNLIMHGVTVQQSGLGDLAVLIAQKNPQSDGTGTIFMMAADTPSQLNDRVQDLISPSIWGQLGGDFFAWENPEQPALVMQVADVYVVGEFEDSWLQTRMWLSNHPWYWLIAFIVLVLFCSFIAYWLLRRRNNKMQDQW